MTHFSEEWYDRKRANIAAWKAMEAARAAQSTSGGCQLAPRARQSPIPAGQSGPLTPKRPLPPTDRADAGATTPAIPSGVGGTRAPIDCSRGPATAAPATVRARPKADAANGRQTIGVADAASRAPIYPLVGLCRAAGLPEPVPEYRFHAARKWRADYAWPLRLVIVEIDGGVWTQGRHTRGAGVIADQRKLNAAALLGYRVLRYTPDRLMECVADLSIMFAGGGK